MCQGISGSFPNAPASMKVSSLFFTIFGTPDDIDNLQVLTAKENSLKAAIWGLYTNINADKKWAKMSPTTQIVCFLSRAPLSGHARADGYHRILSRESRS